MTAKSKLPAVMVVDDHPLWRDMLCKVIEQGRSGRVVAAAGDGDEAVRLAAEHQPDIVVMDMNLPDMDGAEATRALRAARPETRVLVLSSSDDRSTIIDAVRAGASGYLIKTAESKDITDAV